MAFENEIINFQGDLPDFYCVVKDQEQDFYWVINLDDHGSCFLLDSTYQQLTSPDTKEDQESLVIIQPQQR